MANKIAAGEVVERPASVVKELVENALDAGARKISISVVQGGRKLVAVQDDGCGMERSDAELSLERQATSKILDVGDIEAIDTLGFRGEAIPSIASVSRFTLTTRRRGGDEGVRIQVDAGSVASIGAAGCPPGTLVEVRDLFCNVPARQKFLRSAATEESHVKNVFTVHALAHPGVAFSLAADGRELYRLAPAESAADRVRDLFGADFMDLMVRLDGGEGSVRVTGFIERPNQATPTRRDQYVFVNGRPATSPSIAYAMREAYPRRQGDVRPAAVVFIELPPNQVDVNVHPTKREVRFRDNGLVKRAIISAVEHALCGGERPPLDSGLANRDSGLANRESGSQNWESGRLARSEAEPALPPAPAPVAVELPLVSVDSGRAKPWAWFRFLAATESGYLLIETDSGVVTINPHAARERIAFERLQAKPCSQALLIPETVQLPPAEFARVEASMKALEEMGFRLEKFGRDTFKVEAVPQLIDGLSPATVLATVARDLAEGSGRRAGVRWREELLARSVAKSFAGMSLALTPEGAQKLVEELAACRSPYVCPRGKPIMIFTSTRELDRKFSR